MQRTVDLRLRAHVDAARRLVDDQHVAVRHDPLGQNDLLLVAAGQAAGVHIIARGLHAEDLHALRGVFLFLAHAQIMQSVHDRLEVRHAQVPFEGVFQQQALLAAVLGHKTDARTDRLAGCFDRDLFAQHLDLAGVLRVRAEQAAHELRAPRADQTVQAEDLALVDLQIDVLIEFAVAEVRRAQRDLLLHVRMVAVAEEVNVAADHHGHQLVVRRVLHGARADIVAVAEDGDLVAQRKDLLHSVADVDDGDAPRAQVADQGEKDLHLAVGQRGRRLVKRDHAEIVARERAHDLDELPRAHAEIARLGADIDLFARLAEHGFDFICAAVHRFPVDGTGPGARLIAKEDILCHAQFAQHLHFLRHHVDAVFSRRFDVIDFDFFAVHIDLARVLGVKAGDDLQERGFAGAVLAAKRMDLARLQRDLNAVEHAVAVEGFYDVFSS